MINFNRILAVSAIALIALTGCSNKTPDTAKTTTEPTQAAPTAKPVSAPSTQAAPAAGNYAGLLGVVSKTKAAVNAGDFAKAKTEFGQFEDNWSKVEDGLKAKSSKAYDAIEDSVDKVEKALKEAKPDKQKVLAELDSIEKSVNSVAK
jgi:hypothetical protein